MLEPIALGPVGLPSPAATQRLAARLGRLAPPGTVLALQGPLGAGKTCFVQGLARGLGLPRSERIQSPTFNILLVHEGGRLPLYHVDLYRLGDEGELAELGLDDYLHGHGVCAVEWMERFPALAPADHLEVRLAVDSPRSRTLSALAHGPKSAALARAWLAAA